MENVTLTTRSSRQWQARPVAIRLVVGFRLRLTFRKASLAKQTGENPSAS